MALKRKLSTPQDYLQVGMAFFLIGIFVSQVADGRLIGAFFANLFALDSSTGAIQGFAAGLSIPIFCASIFFSLRSLVMLRSK